MRRAIATVFPGSRALIQLLVSEMDCYVVLILLA
jgi:hypothetical protein